VTRATDCRVRAATLWFLPVRTRVPLKFGPETLTEVSCARVRVRVEDRHGRSASGWGETPLSVQWVWPSARPYAPRHVALQAFCRRLTRAWAEFAAWGHPLELGWDFQRERLRALLAEFNATTGTDPSDPARAPGESLAAPPPEPMPWLAALVCDSVFDLAVHDAYGQLLGRPAYATYGRDLLNRDLADFLEPAPDADVSFRGACPADYLMAEPPRRLRAWHLVGGLDPLTPGELTGREPADGYPVLLADWIRADGLKCLKVKLRGTDAAWDYARLVAVGQLARTHGVEWLSADFNCTVTDPAYVIETLDRLRVEHPDLDARLLYVEQPFPYDLERHPLDVRGVAARKPLFLDESAHDWTLVRLGRELGWTGVALKTCKTQSGALLTACWARAHGLALMVQDLTNPMLAQIPHVLLAAHVGTIQGVETNAMQFYPAASAPEAAVHPGLYRRREGMVDWSTVRGPGFGYRLEEIRRELPEPAAACGE
jgi:L-alanine-DL-glutamate epimerase-like enolase superfamily enzyme